MVTTDGPGRKEGRDTTAAWSCRVSFRYGRMSLTTKARQDGAALWPGWRERSVRSAGAASPDIGRTTSRVMWSCCASIAWNAKQRAQQLRKPSALSPHLPC